MKRLAALIAKASGGQFLADAAQLRRSPVLGLARRRRLARGADGVGRPSAVSLHGMPGGGRKLSHPTYRLSDAPESGLIGGYATKPWIIRTESH